MVKGGILLLTFMFAACVSFAGAGGPSAGKEPLVQGKPLSYWLKELQDPDPLAREEALGVLARGGDTVQSAAPLLVELLKDKSAPVRVKAAIALGQFKSHAKEAAPLLLEAWKDGSPKVRQQILPALGPSALENEEVLLLLLRASGDADNQTRSLASHSMDKIRPAVYALLAKALDHADPVVRRQAVFHLGWAGKEVVPSLSRMLKDNDWDTRFQAALALWRIDRNPRANLGVMVEASAKEDPTTRQTAWMVVFQIEPPAKEALAAYKSALKKGSVEGMLPTKVRAAEAVWHITRNADDVLPVYREVIENAPANYTSVVQALAAVKKMGPEAKALRLPLLEILKQGKDSIVMQKLPPVLAGLGPESLPVLVEVAGNVEKKGNQWQRTRAACRTIGLLGKDGIKALVKLMEHKNETVRLHAYDAVQFAGPDAKDALPALRKALKHTNPNDRSDAARALVRFGPDAKASLAALLEVVRKDRDPVTRRYVLAGLPHLQPPVEEILPLLEATLADPDPLLRLIAADWLWHLDPKDARPVKIVASTLQDANCTIQGLKMLAHRRDAAGPAFPAMTELLSNKSAFDRFSAIRTFDKLGVGSKEHQQRLVAALGDPDGSVRVAAASALIKLGVEANAAIDILAKPLPTHAQWMTARDALAEFGPAAKHAIPAIERQMPAADPFTRVVWIEALAAIDPAMVAKWQPNLEEAFNKHGSMTAARLLGQHNPIEAKYVNLLVEKLQDSDNSSNRLNAAIALSKGGDWARQAVPALRQALEDSQPRVRIQAAFALEKLEPKKHKSLLVLIDALHDSDNGNAIFSAVKALADLGPAAVDAVPALRAAIREGYYYANEALWKIDPKSAMPCVF